MIRDWSLITGRGGLENWRGGMLSFTSTKKVGGGAAIFFSRHAEGEAYKVLG